MTCPSPSQLAYSPQTCWILTDGSMGMINQCLGVAESLGLPFSSVTEKVVRLNTPWSWFTPHVLLGKNSTQFYALSAGSDPLSPPFPDLVLSCGRQAIAPALWIRQASHRQTKVVHIQNPKIKTTRFDAVIVPKHDKLTGANVIETIGAPHRVTQKRLQEERTKFPDLAPRSSQEKIISVILGGPSQAYTMNDTFVYSLLGMIHHWKSKGYRILLSPSRRTPQDVVDIFLQEKNEQLYVWDRETANPYYAMLGLADAIFVTCDSVCMITEACITDKPVFILPLPGKGSRRFDQFHQELLTLGRIQWGTFKPNHLPPLSFETQTPLDENQKIADQLIHLLS